MGTDAFYSVYNARREVGITHGMRTVAPLHWMPCMKAAEIKRKKRRTDLATEAIANPEKHAQRKVGKAVRRKRKMDEEKMAKEEAELAAKPGRSGKKPSGGGTCPYERPMRI